MYQHIYALSAALLLSGTVLAQSTPPPIQWQKCLGGTNEEVGLRIIDQVANGYIVGGSTASNDGDVHGIHTLNGASDGWVVKLKPNGDTAWTKCLGGSSVDGFTIVRPTRDGGFIAVGTTLSQDGDVHGGHPGLPPSTFNNEVWVVKLNANGDTLWTKTLGGTGTERNFDIKQTLDNGYILISSTTSYDGDVHGFHSPPIGNNPDIWVVKLTAAGDTAWTKCLGGAGSEYPHSIAQTQDSGYILSGTVDSTDGDVHNFHGGFSDIWIVKLTASGDTAWTKTLGGTGSEGYFSEIQQTMDGYILVDQTNSNDGDITTGNHGGSDAWIVKLTATGAITWSKTLGGSGNEGFSSIQQLVGSGDYIAVGYTSSNDGYVHGNHGNGDGWIVKLTATGDTVWTECLGGSNQDVVRGVQQTIDNGLIIGGYTLSNDGDVCGNHGLLDIWVVKLGVDTGNSIALCAN
jgi:hypothetical protein